MRIHARMEDVVAGDVVINMTGLPEDQIEGTPVLVIMLRLRSQSLGFDPVTASLADGSTCVEWFVRSLRRQRDDVWVVLASPDVLAFEFEARLQEILGVTVQKTRYSHPVAMLEEVMRGRKEAVVAVIPLAACVCPHDMVFRVWERHREGNRMVTFVSGIPRTAAPIVLDKRVLGSLIGLGAQHFDASLHDSIQLMIAAEEQCPGTVIGRGQVGDLSFPEEYRVRADELPAEVRLEGEDDLKRLGLLLQEETYSGDAGVVESGVNRLRGWRQHRMDLRARSVHRWMNLVREGSATHARDAHCKPLKVLFASACSAYTGAEESLLHLVRFLDRGAVAPLSLISLEGKLTNELRRHGVGVECPNFDFSRPNTDSFIYGLAALRKLRPSILHCNGPVGTPLINAAKAIDLPIVQHVRLHDFSALQDQVIQADALICVSDFVFKRLRALEIEEKRIYRVYNPIDLARFRPRCLDKGQARRACGLPEPAEIILLVSRISPEKRIETGIRAFQEVHRNRSSSLLVIVGEDFGEVLYSDSLKQMVRELGLKDHVRFAGFVHDIRLVMAAADVLMLCSVNEPLARCTLEAMAMGVPVVAANSGGTPEIVVDGETGFLVPPGSPLATAQAVLNVLLGREHLEPMIEAARRKVEGQHAPETHARTIMDIYERVVAESSRRCLQA